MGDPGAQTGPRWVGIGAQRCGTTWFTNLLTQHPEVTLGTTGKELHYFDRFLIEPPTDAQLGEYRSRFPGSCSGEFTPGYLRWPWVPDLLKRACGDEVTLFVILRDPIERFVSLLRFAAYRYRGRVGEDVPFRDGWVINTGTSATLGGMYAQQMDAWREWFTEENFHVDQYERLRRDPQAGIERAWAALGLDPDVRVEEVDTRAVAGAESAPDIDIRPELRASLRNIYAADVRRLADSWDLDLSLWPNFADLAAAAPSPGAAS